jgi:ATP-dependent DNA helicase Rep
MEGIRRRCAGEHPVEVINELIDDIGYEAWLHQNSSSANMAERRMENVRYLVESLGRSLKISEEDDMDSARDGRDYLHDAISKLVSAGSAGAAGRGRGF